MSSKRHDKGGYLRPNVKSKRGLALKNFRRNRVSTQEIPCCPVMVYEAEGNISESTDFPPAALVPGNGSNTIEEIEEVDELRINTTTSEIRVPGNGSNTIEEIEEVDELRINTTTSEIRVPEDGSNTIEEIEEIDELRINTSTSEIRVPGNGSNTIEEIEEIDELRINTSTPEIRVRSNVENKENFDDDYCDISVQEIAVDVSYMDDEGNLDDLSYNNGLWSTEIIVRENPNTNINELDNIQSTPEIRVLNDSNHTIGEEGLEQSSTPTSAPKIAEPLVVDNKLEERKGCRIIDIEYYEEQMREINSHKSPFDCNFSNMNLISEKRLGIAFTRRYQCQMCGKIEKLYSHKSIANSEGELDVNKVAVLSAVLAGVGETTLSKVLNTLNIPSMSSTTFAKHQHEMNTELVNLALEDMQRSAEKAAAIAREKGDVAPDGVPLIMVKCDGAWCKRSYHNNYNALGGCAAIIAADTNEVIFYGVKNKYCIICTKAANNNKQPKEHTCFKNYDDNQSAASMETAIIVEGFRRSEELYGIRFHKMIADGDSSVYKAILDANPYENLCVQKIECKNHLLRNFCTHLRAICTSSSGGNRELCALKKIVDGKILRLRSGIEKAIQHRAKEGINYTTAKALSQDIINAPSHIFGEHLRCAELKYFCDGKPKENEKNLVPELTSSGLYTQILERCNVLADNSTSLLHMNTTNIVESFNSVVAKQISGKRINYTARGSYDARVACAVSSMKHGQTFRMLHKKLTKRSPGIYSKRGEQKLLRKRLLQRENGSRRKLVFKKKETVEKSKSYGENAEKPDKSAQEYEEAKERRMVWLAETVNDRQKVEEETKGQRESPLWYTLRRQMITASNMGKICKLRKSTSSSNTVESMIYASIDSPSMKWGREKESTAKQQVEREEGWKITECGLSIHRNFPFFGASPDGILSDGTLIEVKCPYAIRKMTIAQGIAHKKINYLDEQGNLKKTNNYYYQIQGQLEVTERSACIFIVWTLVDCIKIRIERDEEFWRSKMEPKLLQFYYNCILPEIVDPRKSRSMPLRNVNFEGVAVEPRKKKAEVIAAEEDHNDPDDPDPIF